MDVLIPRVLLKRSGSIWTPLGGCQGEAVKRSAAVEIT